MPAIIAYPLVLRRLTEQGLICNYPNGGSFGFPPKSNPLIRGWIGPSDSTIRAELRPQIRQVQPPYATELAKLAELAWQGLFPRNLWLMPASHWSFELSHGSRDWLPTLIESIGLDPSLLASRTDAAAIQFSPHESDAFRRLALGLLDKLASSDFCIAFPGHALVCTLHHHCQLWWVTPDADLLSRLDAIANLPQAPCA